MGRPNIFSEVQVANKKIRWLFDKKKNDRKASKRDSDSYLPQVRNRALSTDASTEDFVRNVHDDPFSVAKQWVNENTRLTLIDAQKKAIMNEIASQIIPIWQHKDRVGYVLRKIKILFKIQKKKMEEKKARIKEDSIIGEIFKSANDFNPHKMRYHELLTALRKDGTMRNLSEKEIQRREEWKRQNNK